MKTKIRTPNSLRINLYTNNGILCMIHHSLCHCARGFAIVDTRNATLPHSHHDRNIHLTCAVCINAYIFSYIESAITSLLHTKQTIDSTIFSLYDLFLWVLIICFYFSSFFLQLLIYATEIRTLWIHVGVAHGLLHNWYLYVCMLWFSVGKCLQRRHLQELIDLTDSEIVTLKCNVNQEVA